MGPTKTLSRLERLDELTGLLRSSNHHTACALAAQLCISPRTLMRDLDVLRDDVRCFRLDRISIAKIEGGSFKLKNSKQFTEGMEDFISNL